MQRVSVRGVYKTKPSGPLKSEMVFLDLTVPRGLAEGPERTAVPLVSGLTAARRVSRNALAGLVSGSCSSIGGVSEGRRQARGASQATPSRGTQPRRLLRLRLPPGVFRSSALPCRSRTLRRLPLGSASSLTSTLPGRRRLPGPGSPIRFFALPFRI